MRHRLKAALLLGLLGLAGCGGETSAVTSPDDLPPLTAEQLEAIKAQDAQIDEEERGQPVIANKKGRKP